MPGAGRAAGGGAHRPLQRGEARQLLLQTSSNILAVAFHRLLFQASLLAPIGRSTTAQLCRILPEPAPNVLRHCHPSFLEVHMSPRDVLNPSSAGPRWALSELLFCLFDTLVLGVRIG
jgi:hypothetical protein